MHTDPVKPTRIRLRAPEPEDVDCLYLWENDTEMWRYGFSPAPLSRHQIWEYVQQYDADPLSTSQLRLIMEHGGTPVGAVDLYNIDIRNRRAFVGIMTAPGHRRKGFALEALKILASYSKMNLGLSRLTSVIAADNTPSLALFQAAGYKEVATLPQWIRQGEEFIDAYILILTL